ncbi:MAG: GNAT family N-acetyltransferase [Deltaproteobacteria bacterium]|nr:MAG: GNAT family N-acetyltransferase [Deltaproteobacteria bacterium]
MLERYPRHITLKDGTKILLKPMEKGDGEKLWQFFQEIPEEDKIYFKDDVTRKETIMAWEEKLDYEKVLPILAWDGDRVVGDATLHRRKKGWKSRVGDVRVVIHKDYRSKGLGTALIRELKSIASRTALNYLVAEIIEDQKSAIAAFEKMGFEFKARYEDFVTDWKGKTHNLVVLVYPLFDVSEIYY